MKCSPICGRDLQRLNFDLNRLCTLDSLANHRLLFFGNENVWLNSACDWGISDPLSVPKAALEMRRRGYDDEYIDDIVYKNPVKFMSQSDKFKLR